MFHDLVTSSTGTSAAAGGVSSGSAGHHAAISCLVHADVTGTPDRWYSAGIDGVVQVWNGKVSSNPPKGSGTSSLDDMVRCGTSCWRV